MSCPYKNLYSNTNNSSNNNSNSNSNNSSPYTSNVFNPLNNNSSSNVSCKRNSGETTEETINNWGCQVIRDGGLDFNIKTDKFSECKFPTEEGEPEAPSACPFGFRSSSPSTKTTTTITATCNSSVELHHTKTTLDNTMSIDKEGYFTFPLVNMPQFLTFSETKYILLGMDIKLNENVTWDQLNFYQKNETTNEFELIKETKQLQDIIKEKNQTLYFK